MSRAEDLYTRLRTEGIQALDQLLADRELESLFLDFKGRHPREASLVITADENRVLSKAISGFANSAGGVVIWGVDCRRDVATGVEVARKQPLVDAPAFAASLQGAVSRASLPPHQGVQIAHLFEPAAVPQGYVAILVPQSAAGPLRSVATNHYHLRSGSDFGIVPHDVLAGMFGRPPLPRADVNLGSYPARIDGRPGHLTLGFGIFAVNLGAVVGDRPYVSVAYGDFPPALLTAQSADPGSFALRKGALPVFSVVALPGVILAPGASEHVCSVILDVPLSDARAISLDCTLGVMNAAPHRFRVFADKARIERAFAEASAGGGLQTTDVLSVEHS